MSDAEELAAEVLTGGLERLAAASELRGIGINPSPADVEHYLLMSPRQRRQANTRWLVMQAAGFFGNPA